MNGTELYGESAGVGEPVLFLHGGFCSLESMRPQFDAVAADFAAFAFERPGHGRSPDVPGPMSYERGVAESLAYLDAQGLGSAHVVGYSDGAIIGLLLAMEHPERVRSLVAISANLDPSGFVETVSDSAGAAPEGRPDRERELYDALSPDGPAHAEVVLDKLRRLWLSEPHIDPRELARITAPTLVVAADRDAIRTEHTILIASSIPGGRLCIVPGATHGLVGEKPAFVSFLLRDFVLEVRLLDVAQR